MKLLLIRHGETLINVKGLTHYINDVVSLNPKGREEARLLIPVCKKNSVKIIYSSPEARAVDTTIIISNALQIPYKTLAEFKERNWGQWGGQPWEKIEDTLKRMSVEKRYTFIPPNGESWEQMESRINKGLEYIITQPFDTIAIVTHGGVLRALMPVIRKTSKQTSFMYSFKNASVTIFETTTDDKQEKMFKEIVMNDTSHLENLRVA